MRASTEQNILDHLSQSSKRLDDHARSDERVADRFAVALEIIAKNMERFADISERVARNEEKINHLIKWFWTIATPAVGLIVAAIIGVAFKLNR